MNRQGAKNASRRERGARAWPMWATVLGLTSSSLIAMAQPAPAPPAAPSSGATGSPAPSSAAASTAAPSAASTGAPRTSAPAPSGSAASRRPLVVQPQPPKLSDRVWVGLVADDPRAVLERRPKELLGRGDLAGMDGWEALCVAPCQANLDRGDWLAVGGSGIYAQEFVLPDEPGPFTAFATTSSAADDTAGLVLLLTGVSMAAVGGIAAMAIGLNKDVDLEEDSAAKTMLHASVTTAILGGVVFGISVPFRFSGSGAEVRIERGWQAPLGPPPEVLPNPRIQ
jgi:hypothetical protein